MNKLDFLSNIIKKINPAVGEIYEDTVLSEIGLDSLDIVEIQLYYEEYTNKTIPDPEHPLVTIGDLLNLME